MLNEFGPWHIIIVLLIFALLFGSRRLPDAARGLGRSLRIFRAEMQSVRDETQQPQQDSAPAPVQDAVPPQPTASSPAPAPAPTPQPTVQVPVAEPAHPAAER